MVIHDFDILRMIIDVLRKIGTTSPYILYDFLKIIKYSAWYSHYPAESRKFTNTMANPHRHTLFFMKGEWWFSIRFSPIWEMGGKTPRYIKIPSISGWQLSKWEPISLSGLSPDKTSAALSRK